MKGRGKKLLELRAVDAGFGSGLVLQEINLTVYENDFIGIIGANGGGKTTLLKVILGLYKPLRGTVEYFSENDPGPPPAIGYLPQITMFDQKFPITVREVVLSGLMAGKAMFRRFSREDGVEVDRILKQMGIFHLKDKPLALLSGGEMQRAFLSRALVSSPQLLLLDEPDTYVDQSFEQDLYETLKILNKNMAILLVSHDIGMISTYVKTIACVNRYLHYHDSNEITPELMDSYKCPIDLITHGKVPHRVLKSHGEDNEENRDSLKRD
jgi:zinc transport system ATP-binding protein